MAWISNEFIQCTSHILKPYMICRNTSYLFIFIGEERKLVEEVSEMPSNCLSDDDKKLPQVYLKVIVSTNSQLKHESHHLKVL